jgi:hypothetical protein
MMTARDSLLHEILTLTKRPYSKLSKASIAKVLTGYRIQAKPSLVLRENMTAREALEEIVLEAWQILETLRVEDKIKEAIGDYRMQFKQKAKIKSTKEAELVLANRNAANLDGSAVFSKKKVSVISLTHKKDGGPIAGGPKKRQYARSECPKCHSMGVVLARASSGDGYFSCIYCGFQAYRGRLDSELDLPLAAELLGQRFDEEKEVET